MDLMGSGVCMRMVGCICARGCVCIHVCMLKWVGGLGRGSERGEVCMFVGFFLFFLLLGGGGGVGPRGAGSCPCYLCLMEFRQERKTYTVEDTN